MRSIPIHWQDVPPEQLLPLSHGVAYRSPLVLLPEAPVCGVGAPPASIRTMRSILRNALRLRHASSPFWAKEGGLGADGEEKSGWEGGGGESGARGGGGDGGCLLIVRKAGHRHVTNSGELLRALEGHAGLACLGGWRSLGDLDNTGLAAGAGAFADAGLIVAPHGGTLANMLFVGGGGRAAAAVLELLPEFRPNLCYERLARVLGIRYMGLVVPGAYLNRPFEVRIDVLLEAVQELRMMV